MLPDLSKAWTARFNPNVSRYPLFNVANTNNQNEFVTILFDNSNSKEIGEPDWQPYNFKTFTYAKYNFSTQKIETISLNRDSILIPVKYSKLDADDYYRLNIHEKITAYKMDIDKNGEEEKIYATGKGDFEEVIDGDLVTTNMNSFIFGAGAGYKWEYSNFAFGPYASVARGFSSEVTDRFSAITGTARSVVTAIILSVLFIVSSPY